ncbi:hypothetical protein L2E82_35400 [Cichorium intybus]|uniref:Uncharacterized protein n=1 Tax=Cichorium intybus TaxID=13427 RepID=A0ACB9BNN5_CICIN|nr:hypothetical protein L2E82_35400 [Cichorium intybus]
MEEFCDFIQWLGANMSIKILATLENPTDLVRASAVSSSWRRFKAAHKNENTPSNSRPSSIPSLSLSLSLSVATVIDSESS